MAAIKYDIAKGSTLTLLSGATVTIAGNCVYDDTNCTGTDDTAALQAICTDYLTNGPQNDVDRAASPLHLNLLASNPAVCRLQCLMVPNDFRLTLPSGTGLIRMNTLDIPDAFNGQGGTSIPFSANRPRFAPFIRNAFRTATGARKGTMIFEGDTNGTGRIDGRDQGYHSGPACGWNTGISLSGVISARFDNLTLARGRTFMILTVNTDCIYHNVKGFQAVGLRPNRDGYHGLGGGVFGQKTVVTADACFVSNTGDDAYNFSPCDYRHLPQTSPQYSDYDNINLGYGAETYPGWEAGDGLEGNRAAANLTQPAAEWTKAGSDPALLSSWWDGGDMNATLTNNSTLNCVYGERQLNTAAYERKLVVDGMVHRFHHGYGFNGRVEGGPGKFKARWDTLVLKNIVIYEADDAFVYAPTTDLRPGAIMLWGRYTDANGNTVFNPPAFIENITHFAGLRTGYPTVTVDGSWQGISIKNVNTIYKDGASAPSVILLTETFRVGNTPAGGVATSYTDPTPSGYAVDITRGGYSYQGERLPATNYVEDLSTGGAPYTLNIAPDFIENNFALLARSLTSPAQVRLDAAGKWHTLNIMPPVVGNPGGVTVIGAPLGDKAPTVYVADEFTGADGSPVSSQWTVLGGTASIQNNAAVLQTSAILTAPAPAGVSDMDISQALVYFRGFSNNFYGPRIESGSNADGSLNDRTLQASYNSFQALLVGAYGSQVLLDVARDTNTPPQSLKLGYIWRNTTRLNGIGTGLAPGQGHAIGAVEVPPLPALGRNFSVRVESPEAGHTATIDRFYAVSTALTNLTATASPISGAASVVASTTQTYTASATGAGWTSGVWAIESGEGYIQPYTGVFTAPATPGTTVISWRPYSGAASTKSLAVTPAGGASVSSVNVSPTVATVAGGGSQQFYATVNGTGGISQNVTWSTVLGSISPAGLLQAPAATGADQVFTVRATSQFDASKFGEAQVTVPGTATGHLTFTAKLNGSTAGLGFVHPLTGAKIAGAPVSGQPGFYTLRLNSIPVGTYTNLTAYVVGTTISAISPDTPTVS